MAKTRLTPEMLELVAERFKVLAEPVRLGLLNYQAAKCRGNR